MSGARRTSSQSSVTVEPSGPDERQRTQNIRRISYFYESVSGCNSGRPWRNAGASARRRREWRATPPPEREGIGSMAAVAPGGCDTLSATCTELDREVRRE